MKEPDQTRGWTVDIALSETADETENDTPSTAVKSPKRLTSPSTSTAAPLTLLTGE